MPGCSITRICSCRGRKRGARRAVYSICEVARLSPHALAAKMHSVMWSRQENEKMVGAPPAPLPPTAFLLRSRRRRPAPQASGGIASTTARFTRRRHGRSSPRRSPATTAIPYSQFPSNRGEQTPSFRRPWRARQTVPRLRSSTIPASRCTGSGPGRAAQASWNRSLAQQGGGPAGFEPVPAPRLQDLLVPWPAGRCPGIDGSDGAAPRRLALGPFGRQVFQVRSAPQGLQRGPPRLRRPHNTHL